MRKFVAVGVLFGALAWSKPIRAQQNPTPIELYGGYEYVRFNIHANVAGQLPSQTFNGNGGDGELVYNVNRWLGALGDFSGLWATNAVTGGDGAAIPYLFGPRVNLRTGRDTPFVQILLGGVATSSGLEKPGWQSHFAMTAGGGIDFRVSEHLSLRPLQAEYFMTKIPNGLNNRQNNFRYSAGVSLLLGKRRI